jgi:hypothetical protein
MPLNVCHIPEEITLLGYSTTAIAVVTSNAIWAEPKERRSRFGRQLIGSARHRDLLGWMRNGSAIFIRSPVESFLRVSFLPAQRRAS